MNVKLIAIVLCPYQLLREFTSIVIVTVYISPFGNSEVAGDVIRSVNVNIQTKHPSAFIYITGDFNHVSLSSTLPILYQFVNYKTRENKTLYLLYATIKYSNSSIDLCPLGRSDHNKVQHVPQHKPVVQWQPAKVRNGLIRPLLPKQQTFCKPWPESPTVKRGLLGQGTKQNSSK